MYSCLFLRSMLLKARASASDSGTVREMGCIRRAANTAPRVEHAERLRAARRASGPHASSATVFARAVSLTHQNCGNAPRGCILRSEDRMARAHENELNFTLRTKVAMPTCTLHHDAGAPPCPCCETPHARTCAPWEGVEAHEYDCVCPQSRGQGRGLGDHLRNCRLSSAIV